MAIMFVLNTVSFTLLREPLDLENILSAIIFSLLFSPIMVLAVGFMRMQREWADSWLVKRGPRKRDE